MPAIRPAPRDDSFQTPAMADPGMFDYLSTVAYDTLYHMPIWSLNRYAEKSIESGPLGFHENEPIYQTDMLSPEAATKKYGLDGELTFKEPTLDGVASMMYDRKMAELRREYLLSAGSENHWGRKVAGFGTSMATSLIDPVNLAAMFIPVVGEERLLQGANRARGFLDSGLVSSETLMRAAGGSKFKYRALKGAMEGAVGTAMIEPLVALPAIDEQAHYGWEDSLHNVLFGAVVGSALHSIGGLVKDKFTAWREASRHLEPQTHEAATMAAVHDLVRDETVTSPAEVVNLDRNVVESQVRWDIEQAKQEAMAELRTKNPELFHLPDESIISSTSEVGKKFSYETTHPGLSGTSKFEVILSKNTLPGEGPWRISDIQMYGNEAEPTGHTDYHTYQEALSAYESRKIEHPNAPETQLAPKPTKSVPAEADKEIQKRIKQLVDKKRNQFKKENPGVPLRQKVEPKAEGEKVSVDDPVKQTPDPVTPATEKTLKEDNTGVTSEISDLEKELNDQFEAYDKAQGTDPISKAIKVLDSLKIGDNIKGMQAQIFPTWIWNGGIDAVIAGLKAGKKANEALSDGIQWVKKNWKTNPDSRRLFLKKMGLAIAGTQVPLPKMGELPIKIPPGTIARLFDKLDYGPFEGEKSDFAGQVLSLLSGSKEFKSYAQKFEGIKPSTFKLAANIADWLEFGDHADRERIVKELGFKEGAWIDRSDIFKPDTLKKIEAHLAKDSTLHKIEDEILTNADNSTHENYSWMIDGPGQNASPLMRSPEESMMFQFLLEKDIIDDPSSGILNTSFKQLEKFGVDPEKFKNLISTFNKFKDSAQVYASVVDQERKNIEFQKNYLEEYRKRAEAETDPEMKKHYDEAIRISEEQIKKDQGDLTAMEQKLDKKEVQGMSEEDQAAKFFEKELKKKMDPIEEAAKAEEKSLTPNEDEAIKRAKALTQALQDGLQCMLQKVT